MPHNNPITPHNNPMLHIANHRMLSNNMPHNVTDRIRD
jgi:hypothetical protein